nr:hypothetical protein TSUD_385800 [Ipomoea trifida]
MKGGGGAGAGGGEKIPSAPGFEQRRRLLRWLSLADHPHLVPILGFSEAPGEFWGGFVKWALPLIKDMKFGEVLDHIFI